MKRLIVVVLIAVLGVVAYNHFKKKSSPTASIKIASVPPRPGILAASNEQVLAINTEGHIYGFGLNRQHELGLVGVANVPVPKLVSDQRDWRNVHLGSNVSLAIDKYGKLWRRLYLRNDHISASELSEIGERTYYYNIAPELNFRKAMENYGTAVALDEMQRLWAWRESSESFASQYNTRLKDSPPERIEIQPMKQWHDFCFADNALLAVDDAGLVWQATAKELEEARKNYSSSILNITLNKLNSSAPPVQGIYCKADYGGAMLLDNKGELWGYGANSYGELGMGDGSVDLRKSHPVKEISHLAPGFYSEIAPGSGFTLAIHRDGSLWAWGLNTSGQLGIGKETSGSDKPRLVDNTHTWIAIAAGHSFATGMTSDGALYTWGKNNQGTLGEGGSTTMRDRPLPVFDKQKWGGSAQ